MANASLTLAQWIKYRDMLARVSEKAAEEFRDAVFATNGRFGGVGLGNIPRDELIAYAYALIAKYSEGSAAAACEMYDAIALLSGVSVPPAVPADVPTIAEVGKAINGVLKQSQNPEVVSSPVSRLVKRTGQDTTLQNALRDGAEAAWIPFGDTCAFCIALASRGWQTVSKKTLKNGHAEHIHGNCDCAYAVRFNSDTQVEGYEPEEYKKMYYDASDGTPTEKINAMRREFYQENKDKINAQKREAYQKRKELNSPSAEETNV